MKIQAYLILFFCVCSVACGGKRTTKPAPAPVPSTASKPAPTTAPPTTSSTKPGGYYLDDGPGDNPPQDIDSIPNAVPKKEALLARANRPYKALGAAYTPMTSYQPYKATGVSSWYGKRYHGKKTSSGEVYDMYGMTAAHPTLPLPSYVKVTNPANSRFVVVRVNDRGPFKHDRIIDLSYAAAYKLRFSTQGSTLVQVEAIDTNNTLPSYIASYTQAPTPSAAPAANVNTSAPEALPVLTPRPTVQSESSTAFTEFFIQAGAFKSEVNADALIKKIQGLEIEQNAGINKVYNNDLHRVKLGPYDSKQAAEQTATTIRKRLNISTIITDQ